MMAAMIDVTIGVPTFNRADGLRRALESIASQTVQVSEVIVSDNCSPGSLNEAVVEEFKSRIPGLRFVKQSFNIGAQNNFLWLLKEAKGTYFMWLADDDELRDSNYLEVMHTSRVMCPETLLLFPEISIFFDESRANWLHGVHYRIFEKCVTDWDYLLAFCGYGGGHCFYGMWNRAALLALKLELLLDDDIAYFNEGRFLHTIFLKGGIRFEPRATLVYDGTAATKKANRVLLTAFSTYSYRVHKLYFLSALSLPRKFSLFARIAKSHYPYLFQLWRTRKR
jgi:glycosyltransferase involved in cell wall biosynthesis